MLCAHRRPSEDTGSAMTQQGLSNLQTLKQASIWGSPRVRMICESLGTNLTLQARRMEACSPYNVPTCRTTAMPERTSSPPWMWRHLGRVLCLHQLTGYATTALAVFPGSLSQLRR